MRWIALVLLALLAGCARGETFAQYPGFERWFREHPRSPKPPLQADRALLQQYRPLLHVSADAPGPLDFYLDYVAHGTLRADGQAIEEVDADLLRLYADDPAAVFTHEPGPRTTTPTAYGRVDRARLAPIGDLTFLTWHFVFRHSGLPAGLPGWQEALAAGFGDPDDWHQLDHYTAATLVLGRRDFPLGLILQQHNHLRAYWFGRDLELPADGRIRLAAAVRSNELYPRPDRPTRHRAVRFLEPDNLFWLVTGNGERPLFGAHDEVRPGREVDYKVTFLAQTDPFYRFQGRLGARRLLPGRDGPPGADYKTLPAFMDRTLQFCAFRWSSGDGGTPLASLQALLTDPASGTARARLLQACREFVRERMQRQAVGYNAALVDPDAAQPMSDSQ